MTCVDKTPSKITLHNPLYDLKNHFGDMMPLINQEFNALIEKHLLQPNISKSCSPLHALKVSIDSLEKRKMTSEKVINSFHSLFESLPLEINNEIVSYLCFRDLGNMSLVNRLQQEMADREKIYKINQNHLSLQSSGLSLVAMKQFVKRRGADLKYLELDQINIPEVIELIHWCPHLTHLKLQNCAISHEDAIQLAQAHLSNLTTLELNKSQISSLSIKTIGDSTTLSKLHTLILKNNQLDSQGVLFLTQSKMSSQLKILDLSYNQIGAEGFTILAQSPGFLHLRGLNVQSNDIGNEGLKGLKDTSLVHLNHLTMSFNGIDDRGIAFLALCKFPHLLNLNFSFNQISDIGALVLATCSFPQLKNLDLQSNQIGSNGAAFLATSKAYKQLESLWLSSNSIGSEGASEFAKATAFENLKILDLQRNGIEKCAANDLIHSVNLRHLKLCNLSYNSFHAKELSLLQKVKPSFKVILRS